MNLLIVKWTILIGSILFANFVQADIFRCAMSDGKIAYQDIPCSLGKKKTVLNDSGTHKTTQLTSDEHLGTCLKLQKDSPKRAECISRGFCMKLREFATPAEIEACVKNDAKRAMERDQSFKNSMKQIQDKVLALSACAHKDVNCGATVYQSNLKCLPLGHVEMALGSSDKTQSVGGQEFVYYNVPIHNGKRFVTSQLQLVIGFCGDMPMPGGATNRVSEVNVW